MSGMPKNMPRQHEGSGTAELPFVLAMVFFSFLFSLSLLGVAAVGPHYIAGGLHTGTLVLFEVMSDAKSFVCRVVDSQRLHAHPITDMASTTIITDVGICDVRKFGCQFFALMTFLLWLLRS